jgi:adenosylmethionine-8-amino-7-oxononanoate aminotransferase
MNNWETAKLSAFLIADEMLTGTMFASQRESVIPDIMILAKSLTGGYVPLAITLLTEKIFSPFVDGATDSNTLFYGHSYTGNAIVDVCGGAS